MRLSSSQLRRLQSLGLSLPRPRARPRLLPLFSISGLTLLSLGGLVLLKSRQTPAFSSPSLFIPALPSPTQVPKSIQHYLLASQQHFSQALELQQSSPNSPQLIALLNQSLILVTDAIKSYPSDYRGYHQRARIYQSLLTSQPQFLAPAIADLSAAVRLHPTSADLTRELAALYAQKNDPQSTLVYLTQTVILEPTKAQNFYDLAKLQQQIGLLPQALDTYHRLLPLLSDPTQKQHVKSEKAALEKLLSQTTVLDEEKLNQPTPTLPVPTLAAESPLLQTNTHQGLIIAAPETSAHITVRSLTSSNSLSGTALLPAGQKSLTLTNTHLKPVSQVYLTATKGGKNLNLQLLAKFDQSFLVGLDSPAAEDIEFKWWIIN